jgi:hypothetical protein
MLRSVKIKFVLESLDIGSIVFRWSMYDRIIADIVYIVCIITKYSILLLNVLVKQVMESI